MRIISPFGDKLKIVKDNVGTPFQAKEMFSRKENFWGIILNNELNPKSFQGIKDVVFCSKYSSTNNKKNKIEIRSKHRKKK